MKLSKTPNFDVGELPFSRRGSWLSFSRLDRSLSDSVPEEGLYFRTARDRGSGRQLFRLEFASGAGAPAAFTATATPSLMRLVSSGGEVEVCMPDAHSARLRGRGVPLRLVSPGGEELSFALPKQRESWLANFLGADMRLLLTPLRGALRVEAPWRPQGSSEMVFTALPDAAGEFDLVIEEIVSSFETLQPRPSFDEESASVEQEFRVFKSALPSCPTPTAELAAYLCWSSLVDAEGNITRTAMLSSKNRMNGVWSWDHCFNAFALCEGHRTLAWDQIMVPFDHQDRHGAIPDAVFNRRIVWNFTKPPVHGWAVSRMLRKGLLDRAMKEEAYDRLSRWTEFWFSRKTCDGGGMPCYEHGNDSGWDNASVFFPAPPYEAPDLAAYLVLQMEALALLAEGLGYLKAARSWRDRSAFFLSRALKRLTRGDRMVFLSSPGREASSTQSLLPYVQLLLGERLPRSSLRSLVKSLKTENFITPWGLASESTQSPLYASDGYWLGPIWAPSTLLMVDALTVAGEPELAQDIGRKFLALAERSGFSENYDALSGAALRDKAFTWSASVYLLLFAELR